MPNVRKTKSTARRPRRNTRRPKRSVPRSINSIVSKALTRQMETKLASNQYTLTGFNSATNNVGDVISCMPGILQGTGQGARIGASIRPMKLVIRGYISYQTDDYEGARMLGTRLFCYSDRSASGQPTITASGPNYQLLDIGGSATPFTGQTIQYNMPHNTDLFKWYADKKHVIYKPRGLTNTLSGTSDIASMHSSLYKPFTITIPASKMPSQLRYDDSYSTNNPVNFAPLISIGYCDLLGYAPDTTVTQINMTFVATLYYKDA